MSNCLIYAVRQYLRRGGHVVMRKSHWGPWPHFAWSADLKKFEAFVPVEGTRMDVRFPPPFFRGRILITDKP